MIHFKACAYTDIETMVSTVFASSNITVDSFWEDHVLKSNFYQIWFEEHLAGYFAIFEQHLLTLFYMKDIYGKLGQSVFQKVKQFEQVNSAFVSTGDEFFLSHAIDAYVRLEKQAYFSIYTNSDLPVELRKPLEFKRIESVEDTELLKRAEDFFDEDSVDRILGGSNYFAVYKVEAVGELIGFGVIEYGRVVRSIASIGMYVMPEKRKQGYASNILKSLQRQVESNGYQARSGCWYYNHNSKKSMESAGAYSKTRLLKFYF